jgi:hypothetical protein
MKTHLLDTGSKSFAVLRTERGRDLSFVVVLVLEDVQDVVRRILISSEEIGALPTLDDRAAFLVGLGFQFHRFHVAATAQFGGVELSARDDG